MKFFRNFFYTPFFALAFLAVANGQYTTPTEDLVLGQAALLEDVTVVPLGGQLDGTQLEYLVNPADARAGGQDTVTMTYTIPKESWLSIGFTDGSGLMVGAEAVIGLPNSGEVLKYSVNSRERSGVVPMPQGQQTLIESSVVQEGGSTSITFTKILNETGEIPILIGANSFIGAYGFDNELFIHERYGSFGVDLVAGEVAVLETRKKGLWKAHGICAALAWGLFSPLAIGAAILRYWLPNGLWFKLHQGLNMMVAVFTFLAFAFGVAAIQSEGLAHFSPSPSPHRLVGLIVFLFLIVQTLGGVFRPHTPEKGEEKTKTRGAWEIGHRVLGIIVLLVAWFQIFSGISIYQNLFVDSANTPLKGIFWGIVGTIFGIVLVGRVFAVIAQKKVSESTNAATPSEV